MTELNFDGSQLAADPLFMVTAAETDFILGDSMSTARCTACNRGCRVVQQRRIGDQIGNRVLQASQET